MEKRTVFLIVLAIISIFLFDFVMAFGVSSDYWIGNPFKIAPGQTTNVSLRLQNMVGDQDIRVRPDLKGGAEIARLIGETEYLVKAGTKDTAVFVEIKIPENAAINTSYRVSVSFETLGSGEGGTVVFGTGLNSDFDVLVVSEGESNVKEEAPALSPKGKPPAAFWLILLVFLFFVFIGILIIVFIFLKRKRQQEIENAVMNDFRQSRGMLSYS